MFTTNTDLKPNFPSSYSIISTTSAMVLLVSKITKLCSKMDNHLHHHHNHRHHHRPEALLSASLQSFQSEVSRFLNQLLLNLKPGGSEPMSLSWIQQCFGLLPVTHKAFAKLVVEIDYPVSKWEAASMEDFLSHSLKVLELLNSISSSLSHLGQSRIPLLHALSLLENPKLGVEHLKSIQPKSFSKDFNESKKEKENEERVCSGKEFIIHEALLLIKNVGFWVCGTVLSGLCGDLKPCLEMEKCVDFSLIGVDSSIWGVVREKGGELKEMKEVNEAVAAMAIEKSSSAAEELQRRLEVFGKKVEDLEKVVDHLFHEVLATRNELLDGFRLKKQ